MSERQFTGRHAAIVFVSAFGVIIAANIALAVSAVRTFPGLEVANSYVASQEFDARREAQEALGWRLAAQTGGGLLSLAITDASGAPVKAAELNATVGRPTEMADDFTPEDGALSGWGQAALGVLIALIVALTVLAGPVSRYARATAAQLYTPEAYIDAVLGTPQERAARAAREQALADQVHGADHAAPAHSATQEGH